MQSSQKQNSIYAFAKFSIKNKLKGDDTQLQSNK